MLTAHHQTDHATEVSMAAAKAAPPVVVAGATLMGYSLQEWVYILTIIYLLLQIVVLAVTSYRKLRGKS